MGSLVPLGKSLLALLHYALSRDDVACLCLLCLFFCLLLEKLLLLFALLVDLLPVSGEHLDERLDRARLLCLLVVGVVRHIGVLTLNDFAILIEGLRRCGATAEHEGMSRR